MKSKNILASLLIVLVLIAVTLAEAAPVTITWTHPTATNEQVVAYYVLAAPGNSTTYSVLGTTPVQTKTFTTDLAPGAYSIIVRGSNFWGLGSQSVPATTPTGIPTAPIQVTLSVTVTAP